MNIHTEVFLCKPIVFSRLTKLTFHDKQDS